MIVYCTAALCSLLPSLQNEKWMNVRVGDIIKLENNQFVTVSSPCCYVVSNVGMLIH